MSAITTGAAVTRVEALIGSGGQPPFRRGFTTDSDTDATLISLLSLLSDAYILVCSTMRCYATNGAINATTGSRFYPLPEDCIGIIRITTSTGVVLTGTTAAALRSRTQIPPTAANAATPPSAYAADEHNEVELTPVPAGNHTLTLRYYAVPAPLDNANPNQQLTGVPDSLVQLVVFIAAYLAHTVDRRAVAGEAAKAALLGMIRMLAPAIADQIATKEGEPVAANAN